MITSKSYCTRLRSLFVIRHSSFVIRHSSYVILASRNEASYVIGKGWRGLNRTYAFFTAQALPVGARQCRAPTINGVCA
ncbi:hypothetical protein [Coleofasciculus sp. F4-SAH-05]|uniref:hypothetical protein n=1 Tax=Coleofasciculus sp. F4-SAH-05 TaxID=3069525 RepID=UPI0032F49739